MRISFNCPQCGRAFNVSEKHGGKRAKCNSCGTEMMIPSGAPPIDMTDPVQPVAPPPPPPPPAGGPAYVPPAPSYGAPQGYRPPPQDYAAGNYEADLVRAARRERSVRRSHKFLIAFLGLLAFFLPQLGPGPSLGSSGLTLSFPNIDAMTHPMVDLKAKLFMGYPLAIAVICLLTGIAMHNRARGVILLATFGTPIVAWFAWRDEMRAGVEALCSAWAPVFGLTIGSAETTRWLLLAGGLLLMLVGLSSRGYRPKWGWIYLIGAAGAVLFGLSMVWSVSGLSLSELTSGDSMVVGLFNRVKAEDNLELRIWYGCALAMLGLFALAGLLSLLDFPGMPSGGARWMSRTGIILCRLGLLLALGLMLYQPIRLQIDNKVGVQDFVAVGLELLKRVTWVAAWLFLLPAGFVDLIIGPPPKVRAEDAYAAR
jgi:hypothetical protein